MDVKSVVACRVCCWSPSCGYVSDVPVHWVFPKQCVLWPEELGNS